MRDSICKMIVLQRMKKESGVVEKGKNGRGSAPEYGRSAATER